MQTTRQNAMQPLSLTAGHWPMRIRKQSKEAFTLYPRFAVKALAETVGMAADDFSKRIIEILVDSADLMYEDDVRNVSVADFCDWWGCDLRFVALQIPGLDARSLGKLRLFGTGDCPECGGEMEVVDGEYWSVRSGFDIEPECRPIWESKRCTCCGYQESDEPSFN